MKKLKEKLESIIEENEYGFFNKKVVLNLKKSLNTEVEISVEITCPNIFNKIILLEFTKGSCHCNNKEFFAHQKCFVDVVVDGNNNFLKNKYENFEQSVYESEKPYGQYTCSNCGEEFNELKDLKLLPEDAFKFIASHMEKRGIDFSINKKLY